MTTEDQLALAEARLDALEAGFLNFRLWCEILNYGWRINGITYATLREAADVLIALKGGQ